MKKDIDGKPVVEPSAKGLGVRIGPSNEVDLDPGGLVILNGKGMSVSPRWQDLPPFLIPARLRDRCPDARNRSPEIFCFTMGEGPFQDGPVAAGLELRPDRPTHGVVVPQIPVTLEQYQSDLTNTRNLWSVDES